MKNFTLKKKKPDLMTIAASVLLVIALVLLVLSVLFKIPTLEMWYDEYEHFLDKLELRVAALGGKWIIIGAVLFLFALKSVLPLPIFPISCVCVISSMVFCTAHSLLLNLSGFSLLFSIRYYIGHDKKTFSYRLLKSYDGIWRFLESDSGGNPWFLFLCRIIPLFPVNTVSNIYGSMKYDFHSYLLISLLGFLPKIISYTIIGRNAFNPFSASFIIPLMFSCLFSGVGLLITKRIILIIRKKGEEDVKI